MDAREFGTQVDDLEKKLDRLRALYEQYFMGIEKTEPGVLRHDFERHVQSLRRERCNNTAQRFRFQTLIQRHTTLAAYWQRVCRSIEEGTYQPHILRAQRRLEQTAPPPEESAGAPRAHSVRDLAELMDLDLEPGVAEPPAGSAPPPPSDSMPLAPGVKRARSLEDLKRLLGASSADAPSSPVPTPPPDKRPTLPPPSGPEAVAALEPRPADAPAPQPSPARPPAAAGPVPAHPGPGGLSDDKIRSIHAAFAAATQGAAPPSAAAIRRSLEKEFDRMTKKHPGKQVDFRVDLKDGKPVIKSFVS